MFIRELLEELARSRVRYCVIGGVAVNLHGIPRVTYDLDLVVELDAQNLAVMEGILIDFGLQSRLPVRLADFADPTYRTRMRSERQLIAVTFTDPDDPLREVDILVAPPLDPVALVREAVVLDLGGRPVRVINVRDLIALKRASGRQHDLDDVAHLERILADGRED